jgi:hypothetical protein
LSFLNCEKFSLSHKEKFFDPKDLPRLSLEHIGNFWDTDSLKYGSNPFVSCSTYLAGVELRGNEKRIDVAVFKSQADAINCMEGRINTVANVIKPGTSNDILKGKWWFGDGIPNAVFVNQWNTIVEVCHYHPDYEGVKTLLMETAAEIARRVDSLSN